MSEPKDISSSYDTILKESASLTTFSGILFGFILNISVNPPISFSYVDKVLVLVALYSITVAACLFVMPIIYHHIQFPYHDFDKFRKRSHRFMLIGLIPAGITLVLGLASASSSLTSRTEALILSVIPIIMVLILYIKIKL